MVHHQMSCEVGPISGMARYIYCFCLQCFGHLLCELAFFSCDDDATYKLQRQVDG